MEWELDTFFCIQYFLECYWIFNNFLGRYWFWYLFQIEIQDGVRVGEITKKFGGWCQIWMVYGIVIWFRYIQAWISRWHWCFNEGIAFVRKLARIVTRVCDSLITLIFQDYVYFEKRKNEYVVGLIGGPTYKLAQAFRIFWGINMWNTVCK